MTREELDERGITITLDNKHHIPEVHCPHGAASHGVFPRFDDRELSALLHAHCEMMQFPTLPCTDDMCPVRKCILPCPYRVRICPHDGCVACPGKGVDSAKEGL